MKKSADKSSSKLVGNDLVKVKRGLLKKWKVYFDTIPPQSELIQPTSRPVGSTGVFLLTPSAIDLKVFEKELLKKGNATVRRNFRRYLTHLYSTLVDRSILPDGTLGRPPGGIQLHSKRLKAINRNYAAFHRALMKHGLLDLESLHNNDPKRGKVKCRSFNIPPEIASKGFKRSFLSQREKKDFIKTIRVSREPDETDIDGDPVLNYVASILRRTSIDEVAFENLEIEAERFCRIYQSADRLKKRKIDLRRNETDHRLSSGYLYAPKEFRTLMRLDRKFPFVEGDVSACHFHFLLGKMTDPKEREQMKADLLSLDPYLTMCGNPVGVSREALKQNSHKFKYGNRVLNFWGMTDLEASKAIKYEDQLFFRHISTRYPVFAEAMAAEYVRHKSHRSRFACAVMQAEARVMVQAVGERCRTESLIYLPVHDGFMTLPEHYDRICEIVTDCFRNETGSVPQIKRK